MNTKRHGDLIFSTVEETKGKLLGEKSFVLSVGEKHNHEHKITTKTKEDEVKVYEGENGELVIEVRGKAVLTHPEHKTLEFGTGIYKMHKELEYDYFAMNVRKVID